MQRLLSIALFALLPAVCLQAQEQPVTLAEPWQGPYAGMDATGEHVIALWQFDGDDPLMDASGHGHALTLKGGSLTAGGRFGGALESFRGWPDDDSPHGATAAGSPDLSPAGPFTLEMWLCPKPELAGYGEAYLLDKRYGDRTDYQLVLSAADTSDSRTVRLVLGLGTRTATFISEPAVYEPGVWHHVAVTYDTAGTACFYRDGVALGSRTEAGARAISPGTQPLMIGDRLGSRHFGFPGYLDQVRICEGVLEFRPVTVALSSPRTVFVRRENARMEFTVTNRQAAPLVGGRIALGIGSGAPTRVELPDLAAGTACTVPYEPDTSLRPDRYALRAEVNIPGDPPYVSTTQTELTIVPRPVPGRMPVIMWGGATIDDAAALKDIGFTHFLGLPRDYKMIWDAGAPGRPASPETLGKAYKDLDRALAEGLCISAYLYPGRYLRDRPEFQRVDRSGKPYDTKRPDICPRDAAVREYAYNVGASVAQAFGQFPSFAGVDVHSEVRDDTQPCFHEADRAAFKAFSGYDIPELVTRPRGIPYTQIPDFPADRVIPDDYPLYVYYKWFWKDGDGWNELHNEVLRGLRSCGRDDLLAWFAPTVRVPSVWGSGGDVDVLCHWTYSYPDPIRIGLATDELLAMASGSPRNPQIIKATQLIWYRSQTAPEADEAAGTQTAQFQDADARVRQDAGGTGPAQADWEREQPDARFITIAPMQLREAVWTKLSRPIQGLMHHGWQSLVPGLPYAYCYTHPDTQAELRRLLRGVVEPLGPTLRDIPNRPSDIGFLEGFASQMFAQRGSYGWNTGWASDLYMAMGYAQLQPEIIYEESIQRDGLDRFKVLVLADCDVLTESVVATVRAFQARGGLVIGDERLTPALKPDILIQSFQRPKQADQARALLQETAAGLRAALDPRYERFADSSNPDVVVRVRGTGPTWYVFAINDRREFGDYVGHHGLVMENGLPAETVVTLAQERGYVYDLVAGREVTSQIAEGRLSIPVALGPGEGKVFMVTPEPLAGVDIELPQEATRGDTIDCRVQVLDGTGKPVAATVPVQVEITDPAGRVAEHSGYYGAVGGQVALRLGMAPNDRPGAWRVHVRNLASGHTEDGYFRLNVAPVSGG